MRLLSERLVSPTLFKIIVRNRRAAVMTRRALRRKLRHHILPWKDFEAEDADNG